MRITNAEKYKKECTAKAKLKEQVKKYLTAQNTDIRNNEMIEIKIIVMNNL